jgi:hypothetical protein
MTEAPVVKSLHLTDEVVDAALCEYWDLSPRNNWNEAQRVGMRKAILTALGVSLSSTDRPSLDQLLHGMTEENRHEEVPASSTDRCADPSNCPYPVCVADGHCESSPDFSPERGGK